MKCFIYDAQDFKDWGGGSENDLIITVDYIYHF